MCQIFFHERFKLMFPIYRFKINLKYKKIEHAYELVRVEMTMSWDGQQSTISWHIYRPTKNKLEQTHSENFNYGT